MQLGPFVLQRTDTCFSEPDIIPILPLFSIWATSISVAGLSELSDPRSKVRLPCIRALWSAGAKHKMLLRTRDHTTGSAESLRPPLYIMCHQIDLV